VHKDYAGVVGSFSVIMKRRLLDILACPRDKAHPLDLAVTKEEGGEIVSGTLTCPKCREVYPIEDGIPNMLLPEDRD